MDLARGIDARLHQNGSWERVLEQAAATQQFAAEALSQAWSEIE